MLFKINENNKNIKTLTLFRVLIYSWLLFYHNTLAIRSDFFYGMTSFLSNESSYRVFGNSFLNLFSIHFFQEHPLSIVIILNILIFLNLYKIKNRFLPILIFFFSFTLDTRAYPILDAGNIIIRILLVYNIFFDLKESADEENYFSGTLSNLTLFMARFQVGLVYFVAGAKKLEGIYWTNGTALYYSLSLDLYTYPFIKEMMKTLNPYLIMAATYGVVAFQLSFIFLIWFKPFKKIILMTGLMFHLFIGLVMGLNYFALAFCVSYFLFYTDEDFKKKSPSE